MARCSIGTDRADAKVRNGWLADFDFAQQMLLPHLLFDPDSNAPELRMFNVSNDQLRSSGIDLAHINFAPAVGSQEAVDVLTEIANTYLATR